MSDLSQPPSLEEEFLEVESEDEGCARVDTDTESSDIENECSTNLVCIKLSILINNELRHTP